MPADRPLWTPKPGGLIGKPIRRFEDPRLLRGEGNISRTFTSTA